MPQRLPPELLDAAEELVEACSAEPWYAAVDPAVVEGVPLLFLVVNDYQAALRDLDDTYQWHGYPLLIRRSATLRAVVAAGERARKS